MQAHELEVLSHLFRTRNIVFLLEIHLQDGYLAVGSYLDIRIQT